MPPASAPARHRFGPFEFAPEPPRLWRNGEPVALAPQQVALLRLLLTHAPDLVTREQVQAALWPNGIHVTFNRAVNNAVRRLRAVLGDEMAEPRYIATVPGRGYRFIGVLAQNGDPTPASARDSRLPRRRRRAWATGPVLALLGTAVWLAMRPGPSPPQVVRVEALSNDGSLDYLVQPASDGSRIYFQQRIGDHWELAQATGGGGDPQRVSGIAPNTRLMDVSRDGGMWLLGTFVERYAPYQLWRRAAAGGEPVRLGALQADEALWSPDGTHILFTLGTGIFRARADGSAPRRVAALPNVASWMSWSPDGQWVSFTADDRPGVEAVWRWRVGSAAPPVRMAVPEPSCCGSWTHDGRYFLYSAARDGLWNLWALRQRVGWFDRAGATPIQLTFGPDPAQGAFTGGSNDQAVFYAAAPREVPERLDLRTRRFLPLLGGRNAIQVEYAHDGRRLALRDTRTGTLWVAETRADGTATNFRQLTLAGTDASFPRWSPDDRWIAFSSRAAGRSGRPALIAVTGGAPRVLVPPDNPGDTSVLDPDWSPDGSQLAAYLERARPNGQDSFSLAIIAAATAQFAPVPGSAGLVTPRWSPDGRWLAAFTADQQCLEIYDFAHRSWRRIAQGGAFTIPVWSRHGHYLYAQDMLLPGQPLFRWRAGPWSRERVADCGAALRGGVSRCGFAGLAPDGSPTFSLRLSFANLRRAFLRLP